MTQRALLKTTQFRYLKSKGKRYLAEIHHRPAFAETPTPTYEEAPRVERREKYSDVLIWQDETTLEEPNPVIA